MLANRLSAAGANVLLLEAGPDTPPDSVPPDIEDIYPRSYFNHAYMWSGLTADQTGDASGAHSPYTQARVMGGGSSLMGMIALRGAPDDYDRWASLGAVGWGWDDVLPYFRAVEHDRDFSGPLHGTSGRVAIRRHLPEDWPPFSRAVARAAERLGIGPLADLNGEFADGCGALPLSATLSSRVTAASAYLDTPVRARPNLRIECECFVEGLRFQGATCTGVTAVTRGRRTAYHAAETVLCAGAIQSPALLMRSGVGPAQHLEGLGIPLIVDLPAVGENLQNHPIVYLATHLRPKGRQAPWLRPGFNNAIRTSSGFGPDKGDLQVLILNKSSWHGLGASVAGLGVTLMQPSSRGTVRLRSPNADELPVVSFRMLSEPDDLDRLVNGFRLATELMASDEVRPLRNEVFAAGYSKVVRRLNEPGRRNAAAADALAALLDGPPWLRTTMLRWGIASGDVGERRLSDRTWIRRTARTRSFGTYHPAGTCAMGSSADSCSVVDERGRVIGTSGLRVVDASVMRTIPRANTNLPVMMVAERAAALIAQGP